MAKGSVTRKTSSAVRSERYRERKAKREAALIEALVRIRVGMTGREAQMIAAEALTARRALERAR